MGEEIISFLLGQDIDQIGNKFNILFMSCEIKTRKMNKKTSTVICINFIQTVKVYVVTEISSWVSTKICFMSFLLEFFT